jgi:hypothetical protein
VVGGVAFECFADELVQAAAPRRRAATATAPPARRR